MNQRWLSCAGETVLLEKYEIGDDIQVASD